MADLIKPSIGWGGTVKIHNGSALYELKNVTSFKPPTQSRERVDATHLKSANRRKEYIAGLYDDTEVTFSLHYRPGTDTDTLLNAALAAGDERAAEFMIPLAGDPNQKFACTVVVTSYEADEIEAGDVMTASVTCAVVGAPVQSAAV